jgi:uncharacterized OB-fold protein
MSRQRPDNLGPRMRPRGEERYFFDAAREGAIGLGHCQACGAWFLPRVICPECHSLDVKPTHAAGRGTLHSYTVCHRAGDSHYVDRVPYVVALVDLEEGVRMMANLVGDAPPRIGMPLRVVFETREDDVVVPQFTSAEAA